MIFELHLLRSLGVLLGLTETTMFYEWDSGLIGLCALMRYGVWGGDFFASLITIPDFYHSTDASSLAMSSFRHDFSSPPLIEFRKIIIQVVQASCYILDSR